MALTEKQKQKIKDEEEYRAQIRTDISSNPIYKNKTIAGLLALFLGGIGIHKFYLGQSKKGIIYLLFFWTSVPLIFSFVEGIKILLMSEKDFIKKYSIN